MILHFPFTSTDKTSLRRATTSHSLTLAHVTHNRPHSCEKNSSGPHHPGQILGGRPRENDLLLPHPPNDLRRPILSTTSSPRSKEYTNNGSQGDYENRSGRWPEQGPRTLLVMIVSPRGGSLQKLPCCLPSRGELAFFSCRRWTLTFYVFPPNIEDHCPCRQAPCCPHQGSPEQAHCFRP